MKKNITQNKQPIPFSIWIVGLASCLINISSALVFAFSGVYLKNILSVDMRWIGLLEGAVEACANAMKVFSGVISDYLRQRKTIMVVGFSMVNIARLLLAASSSFWGVFTSRVLDRIGNGMQSTPRDALVADLSPAEIKGECFGLRQALATAGSFLGGILGVVLMLLKPNDYYFVFYVSIIPAALALIILCFFVKDKKQTIEEKEVQDKPSLKPVRQKMHWNDLLRLGTSFWVLMIIVSVFMLARVSESMLILHADTNFIHSVTVEYKALIPPLIVILYNGSNSLASYPVGRLSDRFSRELLLGIGFAALILSDLFLAFASNLWMVLIGVLIWGVQIGITQSMFLALVADCVPEDLRGTGFGVFYLFSSLALIGAGYFGGMIAESMGLDKMFLISSCVAGVAFCVLLYIGKINKKSQK